MSNPTSVLAEASTTPNPTTDGNNASNANVSSPRSYSNSSVSSTGAATTRPKLSVYVGDLKPEVTEDVLMNIFNTVGPVVSIRVCRDQVTRRSLGYAYVNYSQSEHALKAIEILNFTEIMGKPCRVMYSERDPRKRRGNHAGNIFVKNLDPSVDSKSLHETFSLFGNILSCKVSMDSKGKSLGYGFVHFSDPKDAQTAVEKLNGMTMGDKQIFVGFFKTKVERKPHKNWTNVYIKGFPISWKKEKLQVLCESYGTISSIFFPLREDQTLSKGFAFVNFETNEQAQSVINGLNGMVVQESGETLAEEEEEDNDDDEEEEGKKKKKKVFTLVATRAQTRAERDQILRKKHAEMKQTNMERYKGVNLYIKNLSRDVDEEKLTAEFSQFGTITSVKVMRDKQNGESRGFGFVCFTAPRA